MLLLGWACFAIALVDGRAQLAFAFVLATFATVGVLRWHERRRGDG